MDTAPYLELKNITKIYDDLTVALNDISFTINSGEICGLVGRNGAGKTTAIKVATGLATVTSGDVMLKGVKIPKNLDYVKRYIGYISSEHTLYEYLTGREYMNFIGLIKGESSDNVKRRTKELAEYLEIEDSLDRLIISYSNGTKRKLALMSQLINNPQMLILDELMNGIDPISNKNIKLLIRDMANKNNMAVLISAHQLDVISSICDKVVIMDKGKLLFHGNVQDILSGHGKNIEDAIIKVLTAGDKP